MAEQLKRNSREKIPTRSSVLPSLAVEKERKEVSAVAATDDVVQVAFIHDNDNVEVYIAAFIGIEVFLIM